MPLRLPASAKPSPQTGVVQPSVSETSVLDDWSVGVPGGGGPGSDEESRMNAPTLEDALGPLDNEPEQLAGRLVQAHEQPESGSWHLPMLFRKGGRGQSLFWQVGYDEESNKLVYISGQVGGSKPTPGKQTIVPKRNLNHQQQAMSEAKSRYQKKWNSKGYRPHSGDQVERMGAMLAYHFRPSCWEPRHKNEVTAIEHYPVLVDPKLDGVRAMAWLEYGLPSEGQNASNEHVVFYSRGGKTYPQFIPHARELRKFMAFLPVNSGLDGEFYVHDMTFNKASGMCRTTKKYVPELERIKLYIFDLIIPHTPSEERYRLLLQALNDYWGAGLENTYFEIIPKEWAHSEQEIMAKYHQYLEAGYEGLMIRYARSSLPEKKEKLSYYLKDRKKNILKMKEQSEEEVTVIDVLEGKGGHEGLAIFVVRDSAGREFKVTPCADNATRADWFIQADKCIGRLLTITFHGRSEYGIPRHPQGKAFRDSIEDKGKLAY